LCTSLRCSHKRRFQLKEKTLHIKLVDGHYCIDLPLKKLKNYVVASLRAQFLKSKKKNRISWLNLRICLINMFFLEDMLLKGHTEKVPASEIEGNPGRIWYIPHHRVYHPQKHKLWVVFDWAATYQGKSLNSQLLQEPNLNNYLICVLMRFRHKPIALEADVEGPKRDTA